MIQGKYTVTRKVADLLEGEEFRANRFITDKNENGAYVTYNSQDGSVRHFKPGDKLYWLNNNMVVECDVDFVPEIHRDKWTQLEKLGKCYLDYDPRGNLWKVIYPENPELKKIFPTYGGDDQDQAILDVFYSLRKNKVIHNGHRWFDCRDETNFKKISDDEARKLMM